MLEYMPRQHREFVLNVRKGPTVRIYGLYILLLFTDVPSDNDQCNY